MPRGDQLTRFDESLERRRSTTVGDGEHAVSS
jgi:hypothetical protein